MIETKLGFGCAPILGRVGRQESLQALKNAYLEGIQYFDIARSYGWGEAESLLGEFIVQNKIPRHQLVLTTKFGLVPQNNRWLRVSKNIARTLMNKIPATQNLIKSTASAVAAPHINFTVENAKTSLEQSLKSLRTDYIDNILFHEYDFQGSLEHFKQIINFLETNKEQGIIKQYGFSLNQDLELVNQYLEKNHIKPDIIQIPCSFHQDKNLDLLQKLKNNNINIILHSPFNIQPNISSIFRELDNQNMSESLESETGVKIKNIQELYGVVLSYFLVIYDPYALVTSMFNTSHIKSNNLIFKNPKLSLEQAKAFKLFLEEKYLKNHP